MGLLSLSNELLALVVTAAGAAGANSYIDEDISRATVLRSLRLTCRRLCRVATPILFRTVTLRPADESVAKWTSLLDDPSAGAIRALVKQLQFESEVERQDDCTVYGGGGEAEETELSDEWRAAVARLGGFENADAVYVRFSPQCAVDDTEHEQYDEERWYADFNGSDTMEQRRDILTTVFEAVVGAGLESDGRRKVRSLSIENLQNVVDKKFTDRPCFGQVMTGLEELHVSVATEDDEAAPENAILLPAVARFWPAFAETWLRPAAASLTALTLYSDTYFGAVPFWQGDVADPKKPALVFPRLQSLALGNYTLVYESQADWLASGEHFPRLERLMLDDCPIVSHLLTYAPDPDLRHAAPPVHRDRLELLKTGREGTRFMLRSRLRWDAVFDKLRAGLPMLKNFVFTRGIWRDGQAFSTRLENENVFLARRYLGYHEGIGPSQFLEPELYRPYRGGGGGDNDDGDDDGGARPYYYDVFDGDDYLPENENGELQGDDENGLGVPSNDPAVYKAELEAYNRLNETLARRH